MSWYEVDTGTIIVDDLVIFGCEGEGGGQVVWLRAYKGSSQQNRIVAQEPQQNLPKTEHDWAGLK